MLPILICERRWSCRGDSAEPTKMSPRKCRERALFIQLVIAISRRDKEYNLCLIRSMGSSNSKRSSCSFSDIVLGKNFIFWIQLLVALMKDRVLIRLEASKGISSRVIGMFVLLLQQHEAMPP